MEVALESYDVCVGLLQGRPKSPEGKTYTINLPNLRADAAISVEEVHARAHAHTHTCLVLIEDSAKRINIPVCHSNCLFLCLCFCLTFSDLHLSVFSFDCPSDLVSASRLRSTSDSSPWSAVSPWRRSSGSSRPRTLHRWCVCCGRRSTTATGPNVWSL